MPSASLAAPVCADLRARLDELLRRWALPCTCQLWLDHRLDFVKANEALERATKRRLELRDDEAARVHHKTTGNDGVERPVTVAENLETEIARLEPLVGLFQRCRQAMAGEFAELRELVLQLAPELLVELPRLPQKDSIESIDLANAADQVGRVADLLAAKEATVAQASAADAAQANVMAPVDTGPANVAPAAAPTTTAGQERREAAQQFQDGPQPPDSLLWEGKRVGLTVTQFKVVRYLWDSPNRTADQDDLARAVWDDEEGADGKLRGQRTGLNARFIEAEVPLELRKNGSFWTLAGPAA